MTCQVIDAGTRRPHHADVLRIAFAGTFAATLEPAVRSHLAVPCEVVVGDEAGIVGKLGAVDALVTLASPGGLAAPGSGRRRFRGPGAGPDRCAGAAFPRPPALATASALEAGAPGDLVA